MFKYIGFIRFVIYSILNKNINGVGYIGKPLYILGYKKLHIKTRVRIFPNARIEVHGEGVVLIDKNVSIGQDLHLICGRSVTIGEGTLISSRVLITDLDHEYMDITMPILEQPHKLSKTIVGERCFIGTGAVIQSGTILGKHCVVGANSVVKGVFPDYSVIVGSPGRVVKKFDVESGKWLRCDR
jgi:acetyltransferase-like isoleucine patch superfamily enzyme